MTTQIQDLIKQSNVAAPCPAKWTDMVGDDRVRLCSQCNLHVHNTTVMTDEEVLQLVLDAASGKRVCGRLYRRADGTLLTRNCPVGIAGLRERARRVAAAIAGILSFCAAAAVQAAPEPQKKKVFHGTIRAEDASARVTNKPAGATALPIVRIPRPQSGTEDGMWMVRPSAEMIDAAKKSLVSTESKFGSNSIQAASEHERLANLYVQGYLPKIDLAEEQYEAAYQLQLLNGNWQHAKRLANLWVNSKLLTDPVLKARWAARAEAPIPQSQKPKLSD